MISIFQHLAKASWNRSAALAIAAALLALALAPAAQGAEFTFKGQKIEYENAEYAEITDTTTGEILPVHIHRPKVAPKGSL